MVNFIVLNEAPYEIDKIDILYADQQLLAGQHADPSGVTVLSSAGIPTGTVVSTVTVEGVEIAAEPTPVPLSSGNTVIISLMYYTNPKTGQTDITGFESENEPEG